MLHCVSPLETVPTEVAKALEHARDPGADPALLVLARALEEAYAHAIVMSRIYHRMDRLLGFVLKGRV